MNDNDLSAKTIEIRKDKEVRVKKHACANYINP